MKLKRLNEYSVQADCNTKPVIYANESIHLENSALDELESFSHIEGIRHLSLNPDFHKGAGTPIGTTVLIDRVYPRVTGNDIGCGMRFDVTDLDEVYITSKLKTKLRHAFFGGGREIYIPSRYELLAYGLASDLDGTSTYRVPSKNKAHQAGSLGDGNVDESLRSFLNINGERDNFLGTIGGGNHFVEIQVVDEIVDRKAAYDYGLKVGKICIMCHSGSLDLGHAVGNYFKDKAKENWSGKYPENGYFSLQDDLAIRYIRASYNAANFATVNRAIMASMVADVLETEISSVYDSPHNLVWITKDGFLHRKGSCPAEENEPIIIPGSMGTRSLIALGKGFSGTLGSSPHGAGRILNRNASRKEDALQDIQIVTKIDYEHARSDVATEIRKNLAEEAPRSYKDITQVAKTVEGAGIASAVAWLKPLLTIKG